MKLGLYINTLLIGSPAIAGSGNRPMYPRPLGSQDSEDKLGVLLLSLKSMAQLPIDRVLYNIELSPEFQEDSKEIEGCIRSYFPNALLHSEGKRPTSLAEWERSSLVAAEFFLRGQPIVCVFNHDHIFVDYRIEPFTDVIKEVFEDGTRHDAMLVYSHAPEVISSISDSNSYKLRLLAYPGMTVKSTEVRGQGGVLFTATETGRIDGINVTTAAGLKRMWSAAVANSDYVPRPDWPGVSFEEMEFVSYFTPREFFRHFDGYGHVTTMPRYLGMAFAEFIDNSPVLASRQSLINLKKLETASGSRVSVEQMTEGYFNIFMDNYLLAIRDQVYASAGDPTKAPNIIERLEALFKLFQSTYLETDFQSGYLRPEELQTIKVLLRHRVFGNANAIAVIVIADCAALPKHPIIEKVPAVRTSLTSRIKIRSAIYIKKIVARFIKPS